MVKFRKILAATRMIASFSPVSTNLIITIKKDSNKEKIPKMDL
jgi:hypothetical protein